MKKSEKTMLTINWVMIAAILILNWFYQKNEFDFTLKCVCSGAFAFLGIINFCYALITGQKNKKFHIGMCSGLLLAFLGDVIIKYSFVFGAAMFALGHVFFVIAYCFTQKPRWLDGIVSSVLFLGSAAFLLFCPLLTFDEPIFKVVCIVYAWIISCMLGKATGNFIRKRNAFTGMIALASALFFFSDLMLVFDWFIGQWSWTDHACMGTYYPALCLLAFSMLMPMIFLPDEKYKAVS